MKYAIVLAGGTGTRAGGTLPKQFQPLNGRPVAWWAMKAFLDYDPALQLVVVVHPGYAGHWRELMDGMPESERLPHHVCYGGRSRVESVANGLAYVGSMLKTSGAAASDSLVFIHDGARPLVSRGVIAAAAAVVSPGVGAVPGVPPVDSLRRIDTEPTQGVDRSCFVAVQTPQTFMYSDISAAYAKAEPSDPMLTDDASVAERCGVRIIVTAGDPDNIKITHPRDFMLASALLGGL